MVVAGAGYAGLHTALRLTARLRNHPGVELTLVDRHDYHQVLTELPRVAGGTRAASAVRIPLEDVLAERVRFAQTEITGFDLAGRRRLVLALGSRRLVLALGGQPSDFAIPGLAQRALSLTRPATPSSVGGGRQRAHSCRGPRPTPGAAPPGDRGGRRRRRHRGRLKPASWLRFCPRWPAATAWHQCGPPCGSSRQDPPSW
jgi:NADPH-dependent 2,4-dienoyl-CoA reductase/sulfur reductase-like enzyme